MRRFGLIALLLVCVPALVAAGDCSGCKSEMKFTPYGFVRFDMIYDNTEVAKGDWLLFVQPGESAQAEQDALTATARHTRLGFDISKGGCPEEGMVTAKIELDFAGGFPNSSTAARQPQVRLRHAWMQYAKSNWALRFGQDWALISDPFPGTANFVVGAGAGNLWMRYPQIQFMQKFDQFKYALSLNRPMAGNNKYDSFAGGDFDPVGDGERSGMPWVMGRVWAMVDPVNISVGGHYGQEQINDLNLAAHDMDTYSVVGAVVLKQPKFSLTLNGFYGENLNQFFGGVFQGFVRYDDKVENVVSFGGWGQVSVDLHEKWNLTVGGGMDDPDEEDLPPEARDRNDWIFGTLTSKLIPEIAMKLGVDYMKTHYMDDAAGDEIEAGDNVRVTFQTVYSF
ncbi:MAG: hypothetical protein JW958_12705 [Candidatus Eisenbacteria bacterium]|nr:hypothetical protein [Candidatus Eisenbacteria bacterium]